MKGEINLVSPQARQARMTRLYRGRLAYLARRVIFVWGLLGLVMAGSFWYIWQRQRAVASEIASHEGGGDRVGDTVQTINERMAIVSRWVTQHPTWTPLLPDVLERMPAAIRLEVLALQPGGSALTVRGVSSSRTTVVELQQAFEALPWVAKVEAPLQNFAAGENNTFSFTLIRKTP